MIRLAPPKIALALFALIASAADPEWRSNVQIFAVSPLADATDVPYAGLAWGHLSCPSTGRIDSGELAFRRARNG